MEICSSAYKSDGGDLIFGGGRFCISHSPRCCKKLVAVPILFKRAALYKDPASMPGDVQIVDIDGDGKLEIVSVIFDSSVAKTYPYHSGSIFIFKLRPWPD